MTLTSAADLANKKVIATRGTTNDAELTKIAPKDAQIIRFDDDATSITAVVSGQADIFATAPALLRTINDKAPAKQMESKFVMRLNMLGIGLQERAGPEGQAGRLGARQPAERQAQRRLQGIPWREPAARGAGASR